jgi:hypothetical protein
MQPASQPSDHIGIQGRTRQLIERITDVDRGHNSSCWGFAVIEAVFNPSGDGKKGRSTRAERDDTLLNGRRQKRSSKESKNKPFKNFSCSGNKRYRAVGGAKVRGFSWFEDRNDICSLPDGGEVSLIEGVVIEGGKVRDTPRAHVLEM